jgi:hypothetical protein
MQYILMHYQGSASSADNALMAEARHRPTQTLGNPQSVLADH